LETEAILIANPNTKHKEWVKLIKRRIEGWLTATKYCMVMFNIATELLQEAIKITPGKKSPTVTNLECGTMKAVSSLVLKKEVAEKMDALHDMGATDILVLDLANSRM
jgi:ATP phosphoribosyltransferase